MEDAFQGIRIVFLEEWIGLRLVHERKEPFRGKWARRAAGRYVLKERYRVERLVGGAQMQYVRLPVVDYGEMVVGFRFKRPDREVEISRRERDQEIRVRCS